MIQKLVHDLEESITAFEVRYKDLDESLTTINLTPDKWSLNKILGHLIDSAANNHQRIVRLKLASSVDFPDYKRDEWFTVQHHDRCRFRNLLTLFVSYNKLIGNIIATIESAMLSHRWNFAFTPEKDYITLEELIIHYVDHVKGHLDHFAERLEEIKKI